MNQICSAEKFAGGTLRFKDPDDPEAGAANLCFEGFYQANRDGLFWSLEAALHHATPKPAIDAFLRIMAAEIEACTPVLFYPPAAHILPRLSFSSRHHVPSCLSGPSRSLPSCLPARRPALAHQIHTVCGLRQQQLR